MEKLTTETDLQNLIDNQVEENLYLDYKAAGALAKSPETKKIEISKDVSAMANSDGGIIIYGIKEYSEPEKRHLPEKIDPVNRVEFSREWLEQILNSRISPRVPNITIEPINISSSPTDVVYVVTIPKSNTAHQASDKKYYKRSNSVSTAMDDYEIRDILNRAQFPVIKIEFKIEVETHQDRNDFPMPYSEPKEPKLNTNTELLVYAHNEGKILAKYVNCFLEIPAHIVNIDPNQNPEILFREGIKYVKKYLENTTRDYIGRTISGMLNLPQYGPARYVPILPKSYVNLTEFEFARIRLNNNFNSNNDKIFWTVYADNAEPLAGEVALCNIPVVEISKS